MRKVEHIDLADIVPMPEVERRYYNPFDYVALKNLIRKDGYDESYPIRVMWNAKIQKFECFDGIHRLKAEREIGLRSNIPAIDDSAYLTRAMAAAKGIKANQFRAPYNPIDLAYSLKALGKDLEDSQSRKGKVGRPKEIGVIEIASVMRMSPAKISQLLQLLKLPEDVQNLIGLGKLKFKHALALTKLVGTRYENQIPKLAERTVEKDTPHRELERIVESIKHKGYFDEQTIVCRGCRKEFSAESINKLPLCPDCTGKLRSGELDHEAIENQKQTMQKYLKVRAFVERNFPNDDAPIAVRNQLEQLYHEWNGKRQ